ncbi:MAG: alpha-D-ribose 1-methylphosphonate 5-triphosphate synthase subunit PhnI [Yoonia sp.]|jgi:alpha-D-ribose 1-methylphosphonate 5-triphosphate synthase subunit PhnI
MDRSQGQDGQGWRSTPHIMSFLDRENLIQSDPSGDQTPADLTRTPLELPASRALRLQSLTRADEGFILGMAYSAQFPWK